LRPLRDIFRVEYGNKLDLNKMDQSPFGISFVGRSDRNCGVTARVLPLPTLSPYPPGALTVALGGAPLATFVQQRAFYTAQNVAVLTPLDESMTVRERLFWAMCIRANRFRYTAFGREANRTLRDLEVPDVVPEWVATTEIESLDRWRARRAQSDIKINPSSWPRVPWTELFEIHRGRYIPTLSKSLGSTPSVSSSALNNGVTRWIDVPPEWPAGTITVARNGSVGQAFYQPRPYFATDDVHILVPRGWECTPARGLFVSTLISAEKFRYSYGRKWSLEKMKRATLPLPRSADHVDWSQIDSYMSTLQWSAQTL